MSELYLGWSQEISEELPEHWHWSVNGKLRSQNTGLLVWIYFGSQGISFCWNKHVYIKTNGTLKAFKKLKTINLFLCTLTEGCNLWPMVANAMSVTYNRSTFRIFWPLCLRSATNSPKLVGICSILWYLRFFLLQHYRTSNGISSSLNLTRGKVDDLKVKKKGQTWSLVFHLTMSKNVVWLEIQYYINDFTEYTFPSPNMPKPTQLLWVNYKTRYL